MSRKTAIPKEIANIVNSLRKVSFSLYEEMLECPNLKNLSKSPKSSAIRDESFEVISGNIVETCHHFICNRDEQVFSCNDGDCKYIRRFEKSRRQIWMKLKSAAEALIA